LKARIGINTGLCISGEIGSASRKEFTVIGDTVNLASRLQEKSTPGSILIGEKTFQRIKDFFIFSKPRELKIKGKKNPVTAYILKGEMDGIQVAEEIKKNYDIPIIYLTAHPDERSIHHAKLTAPDGFMIKPVHKTDLKNTIELALYKHRMEYKLRETEKYYKTIFENTGTATAIIDENMTIIDVNSEVEKFTGLKREELVDKKKWKDFVIPEEHEKIIDFSTKRRKDADSAPREYETKVKDRYGNLKDVLVTVANIPGTNNKVISLLDITRYYNIEYALNKSEKAFFGVLEQSNEGIVLCDEKGNIIRWNQSMEKMTGIKFNDAVGHNLAIGAVEILLLSEDLKKKRLIYHCPSCKAKTEKTFRKEVEETEIACPNCGENMKPEESRDLIDEFVEMAEEVGSEVEIISTETEEGMQLSKAFGGIAAILRYRT